MRGNRCLSLFLSQHLLQEIQFSFFQHMGERRWLMHIWLLIREESISWRKKQFHFSLGKKENGWRESNKRESLGAVLRQPRAINHINSSFLLRACAKETGWDHFLSVTHLRSLCRFLFLLLWKLAQNKFFHAPTGVLEAFYAYSTDSIPVDTSCTWNRV